VEWLLQSVLNMMAHTQKPGLVFQGNGRVHLNRRGSQFSRVLTVEECGSAGSDCISWSWIDRVLRCSGRALPTHSIRLFPLHFPSCEPPCAITFQTDSTTAQITDSPKPRHLLRVAVLLTQVQIWLQYNAVSSQAVLQQASTSNHSFC
jgi:NAD(P)H-dependent FMN reductase